MGKVKGSSTCIYRLWGSRPFLGGGDFLVLLGGREVGPVVTNRASGGGCLLIREILKILQSHRRVAGGTKCSHRTHPLPSDDK